MMHSNRVFNVADVPDSVTLATKLAGRTWTLCTAWRLRGRDNEGTLRSLLFCCDATSEDGAFEWAVFDEARKVQIESVTYGWMEVPAALASIERLVSEPDQPPIGIGLPRIDHEPCPCHHCA